MTNHSAGRRHLWLARAGVLLTALWALPVCGYAGSLTPKDVLIIAKAVGFLDPAPSGPGTVAIVYNPADPASKADAEAIAASFGDGLKAGAAVLKPKVMSTQEIGPGTGYTAIIPAAGALNETISNVSKSQHLLCVTSDAAAVAVGSCIMSVRSDPKVEIGISKAGAESAGVKFSSAFLLMAHEK